MIRLLNLGPAKHEKAAIYAVNQRILNVLELWELLCGGAIRRHQLGGKRPFDPNITVWTKNFCPYGICMIKKIDMTERRRCQWTRQ